MLTYVRHARGRYAASIPARRWAGNARYLADLLVQVVHLQAHAARLEDDLTEARLANALLTMERESLQSNLDAACDQLLREGAL